MDKYIKYFISGLICCFVIGIFVAINAPKPSLTVYEEADLRTAVSKWNSDLPRNIGTIGTMDSITYHDRTIVYNITVFGDNGIKEVYKKNYNEFKDILKYSLLSMNGQRNMGNFFAAVLDKKELNLGFRVFTQDGDKTEWNMPGAELKMFMDDCKMSPTTALRTTIDMQIEIASINLPVKLEDLHDPIKSVALNTFLGELDESCLPQSISHVDNDIIFHYDVDENVVDINEFEAINENEDALEILASTLTEDPDVLEFAGILAISHSNMVITYEGRESHNKVSVRIPYSILKKKCKVPQHLLS